MAVYNKVSFEKYLNKEEYRKKKIKKKIIAGVCSTVFIILIALVIIFFPEKENPNLLDDNYTTAINVAIEKFATEKVESHDNYPRLSFQLYSTPNSSIVGDKIVITNDNNTTEDTTNKNNTNKEETNNSNNTNIENTTNNYEDTSNKTNTDNKVVESTTNANTEETTNNNQDTSDNKTDNKNDKKEPDKNTDIETDNEPKEYDIFKEIAGKGNYPGYNVSGPSFVLQMRKEVCLAIKAYTSLPLASGKDVYALDYYDDKYDYVYFFLAGEVKKVDKEYLKQLDEKTLKGDSHYIYNFWISLTRNEASSIASQLLNSGGNNFSIVITDYQGKALDKASVIYSSGDYLKKITADKNDVLIFRDVPYGTARITVEKDGFITYPNEVAYKESTKIFVSNEGHYDGKILSAPLRICLKESSLGKCSFSYATYKYDFNNNKIGLKEQAIKGNYNVHITNVETEEIFKETINFQGEDIYLCEYFGSLKKGIYNIDIYPTDKKQSPLSLQNLYINQYGIATDDYPTEETRFVFSFIAGESATVSFEVQDSTYNGLGKIKNGNHIYSMVETGVFDKERVSLKVVDIDGKDSVVKGLEGKDDFFKGNASVKTNKKYNIYLSTIYGDILLYENLLIGNSDYIFKINLTEELLPKTIADITIKNGNSQNYIIENLATQEKYQFVETQNDIGRFNFKTDTPISSGYYMLRGYDSNSKVNETYIIFISEKSNNYTLTFE